MNLFKKSFALSILIIIILGILLSPYALSFLITVGGNRLRPVVIPADMTDEVFLVKTCDGIMIEGNFFQGDGDRPVVLLSHGIGHNRSQDFEKVRELLRQGCSVAVYDIRAHGRSGGKYGSLGYYEALDIEAVMKWLSNRKKGPVIGWGFSLGAAACINYQARFQGFSALIIQGCFSTVDGTIYRHARTWYGLPPFLDPLIGMAKKIAMRRLGIDNVNFDPSFLAGKITCPVLLVAGAKDVEAPPSDSQEIARNLKGPYKLVVLENSRHNGMFEDPLFRKAVREFIAEISMKPDKAGSGFSAEKEEK